tara:strand:+ start:406 stop:864 length:459 start_codon:yes stop_codon:yes gene_type:complete
VIRVFTRADILPFIKLGEKFWHESNCHIHFGEYDPLSVQKSLDQHLSSGLLVGWASFGDRLEMNSALLAIHDKCFWKDVDLLKEIVWYADKSTRGQKGAIRLYREAEKFARKNNIKKIIMARIRGVPNYDKLDNFYLKNNFKSLEDEYIKDL